MNQGTIKLIHSVNEWQSNYGAMFEAKIELEDGRMGYINMKSPDRWKAGDKIEITSETNTKHGAKWKIQQPDSSFQGSYSKPKPNDDRQAIIDASWALREANFMISYRQDLNSRDMLKIAMGLLERRDELVKMIREKDND